jgi:transposase
MKASSQDLREKVVYAIEQGKTRSDVADTFHLSLSMVKRYLCKKSNSGIFGPKRSPDVLL